MHNCLDSFGEHLSGLSVMLSKDSRDNALKLAAFDEGEAKQIFAELLLPTDSESLATKA
jgi:hypothetical protein